MLLLAVVKNRKILVFSCVSTVRIKFVDLQREMNKKFFIHILYIIHTQFYRVVKQSIERECVWCASQRNRNS